MSTNGDESGWGAAYNDETVIAMHERPVNMVRNREVSETGDTYWLKPRCYAKR